jgi:outer membrane protein OmpA-like peptidoglycan-associated protein
MEYWPPEMLETLGYTSPEFREMVESYVLSLVEEGEFRDPEGRDLRDLEYTYQPSEILENWANNQFTRTVAPLSVEEVAANASRRAEAFDVTLTPDVSYDTNQEGFNAEFQRNLADYAEILESDSKSEDFDANLDTYFQSLIRTDRLVYAGTYDPLEAGTPLSEVMQLLRDGQARWRAPAEMIDPMLTPDVSYDTNQEEFTAEFQRNLAGVAELLEHGGAGAEGLEPALSSYFFGLIRQGRLVDADTGNLLEAGKPLSEVMELLRNGQARWISPEEAAANAAGQAEMFDDNLTPAVSYYKDPQAFKEGFQRNLADYAEILARGDRDPAARGLDAALRSYFNSLIRAGRLVDAADNPLPSGTPVYRVMELLRNGQARWIAP